MCQELKRILVRKSLAATKKLKARKFRRFVRIYTECRHEIQTVFACSKSSRSAWVQRGQQDPQWLAFGQWPEVVRKFFHERMMATPKPKKKPPVDRAAKLRAEKLATDKMLAKWTRTANAAATKIRKYATKLRRIERQIAAQQTAGIAGAGSRSFDFNQ